MKQLAAGTVVIDLVSVTNKIIISSQKTQSAAEIKEKFENDTEAGSQQC